MQIIIHRWQQNRGAYNNQRIELDEVSHGEADFHNRLGEPLNTFWGAIFDGRMKPEPGVKLFRTQKVDRVEVDMMKNEVHIYTSALVERKHISRKGFCKIEGCGEKAVEKGVCSNHAQTVYEPLPPSANSVPIENPYGRCEFCNQPLGPFSGKCHTFGCAGSL